MATTALPTTTTTWGVAQMERHTADGIVITVHYTVDANDGTYSAGAYGSVGLEAPEGNVIPYSPLKSSSAGCRKNSAVKRRQPRSKLPCNRSSMSSAHPPPLLACRGHDVRMELTRQGNVSSARHLQHPAATPGGLQRHASIQRCLSNTHQPDQLDGCCTGLESNPHH
jgi:hypothetical protein